MTIRDKQKTLEGVQAEYLRRLVDFKETLRMNMEALMSKSIDEYTSVHYTDDLPVDEFMSLIHTMAATTTQLSLKHLLVSVTYYDDPNIGFEHIDAMKTDYGSSLENLGDLKNKLSDMLIKTTDNQTMH